MSPWSSRAIHKSSLRIGALIQRENHRGFFPEFSGIVWSVLDCLMVLECLDTPNMVETAMEDFTFFMIFLNVRV